MHISGLQKLTLLDYPEKVACTIFTQGCNFRCPFCHNASFIPPGEAPVKEGDISVPQMISFLKKRKKILDGVCISGGEPLLQPDLGEFLYEIKLLGYEIKLDTNGSFPQKLKGLVDGGLVNYVAMDIKSAPRNYAAASGIRDCDINAVRESAAFLMEDKIPYEFRTTVVRELHAFSDFDEIGGWLSGAERYFLQEFVNSDGVFRENLHPYTKAEMLKAKEILAEKIPSVKIRGWDE